MDINIKTIREYKELTFSDHNVSVESGLLDNNELLELQKSFISELLYYDSESLWDFLINDYESELLQAIERKVELNEEN